MEQSAEVKVPSMTFVEKPLRDQIAANAQKVCKFISRSENAVSAALICFCPLLVSSTLCCVFLRTLSAGHRFLGPTAATSALFLRFCFFFYFPVAHPHLLSSLSLSSQGRDAMNWAIEQLPADFKDRVPSPSLSRKSMHAS